MIAWPNPRNVARSNPGKREVNEMTNTAQHETTVEGVLDGVSNKDIVLLALALQRFQVCAHEYTVSKGKAEKDWFHSLEHAKNAAGRIERLADIMFRATLGAAERAIREEAGIV